MCDDSDNLPPLADAAFDPEAGSVDVATEASGRLHEPGASLVFSKAPPEDKVPVRPELGERFNDIPVEIEAVIGRVKISVEELMRVDPGHRLRLDKEFGEPVDLLVNGRLIGYGQVVSDANDNLIGIKIVHVVR
ncbi:FliM/FliN family flagellar motor switch protein [Mycoplana dimorpha]|uniref:Flagellar motor switch protein FliN n=2 Tax=Mycoplana dimorpha TaxID=28320 RepID=A0A2T5BBB9_MYCDI|nr:FliM/FliN family flagellar motor switch protein [Mycoplana dimorpha]PTM96275.1 flagellar motor switch protein FliN [Mycoplana dimorpha]